MSDASDMDLVREYAERNSEAAFAELARRHVNLSFSVALRFTGNSPDAQDVAQVVFIILAKKAGSLRAGTVLTGWIYETTRLAALQFLRTKARRHQHEQEAQMQSTLENQIADDVWQQLRPLLEEAMSRLNEKERTLLALKYFENRSGSESAALLGVGEWAARKRSERALEKLRKYFSRHGVHSTTGVIARAISANSIQAAPAALAKSVALAAVTKGAAASGSTLTLVKGALKLMAWTKAKTAAVVFVGVLLAAGTTTITVKEIQEHRIYPWEVPKLNPDLLEKVPPQVRIVPAKFPLGGMAQVNGKILGIGQPLSNIFPHAYGIDWARTLCKVQLPSGNFDFIANLPNGSAEALQREIERKFGLKTERETRETDALALTVQTTDAPGLKPANSKRIQLSEDSDRFRATGCRISDLCSFLESNFQMPVTDGTALTQQFDIDLKWDRNDPQHESLKQALLNQLGLELVPTNMPIEMLIVERRP